jgi:iron complex transport system ATP-binding protein
MTLSLRNVAAGYGSARVVQDVSFDVVPGEILCLLGPNGSGKTTLFKTILGLLPLQGGEIRLDGRPISRWPRSEYARRVAYVPQLHVPPFPYTVHEVVVMGRTARIGLWATPGATDWRAAAATLERLGVWHLHARPYTEISGGERQQVLIARALTQEPAFLIMDEPTAHLDFGNQVRALEAIRRLAQDGVAVIFTTHAPDQALRCEARVTALQQGRIIAEGPARTTVTAALLETMYQVQARIPACILDEPGICVGVCPHGGER